MKTFTSTIAPEFDSIELYVSLLTLDSTFISPIARVPFIFIAVSVSTFETDSLTAVPTRLNCIFVIWAFVSASSVNLTIAFSVIVLLPEMLIVLEPITFAFIFNVWTSIAPILVLFEPITASLSAIDLIFKLFVVKSPEFNFASVFELTVALKFETLIFATATPVLWALISAFIDVAWLLFDFLTPDKMFVVPLLLISIFELSIPAKNSELTEAPWFATSTVIPE